MRFSEDDGQDALMEIPVSDSVCECTQVKISSYSPDGPKRKMCAGCWSNCKMLSQLAGLSAPYPQTPFEDRFSLEPLPNRKRKEGMNKQMNGGRRGRSSPFTTSKMSTKNSTFRITKF